MVVEEEEVVVEVGGGSGGGGGLEGVLAGLVKEHEANGNAGVAESCQALLTAIERFAPLHEESRVVVK